MKRHNILSLTMLLMLSMLGASVNSVSAQTPACHNLTQQVWICSGGTFIINGQNITVEGVYVDSLKDVDGCDSVVTYYVNKAPSYHFYESAVISDKSKYPWHGDDLEATGEYEKVFKTVDYDCDSIYHLTLTVYPTYAIYDTVRLCAGDFPYRYDARLTIPTAGDFSSVYKTTHGYDSIYYVHAEKVEPVYSEMQMTMCEGSSIITPSGRVITESGTYTDSLRTSTGCDSIVTIVVNTIPHFYVVDYVTISSGSSYTWHGETYSAAGTYQDVNASQVSGCDSIHELQLTVLPNYHFYDTVTICSSELAYDYHGISCPSAGDYDAPFRTVHGYDSIYSLHLNVINKVYSYETVTICSGESVTLPDGSVKNSAGTFETTVQTAIGCDSVIAITVNVLPSYVFDEKAVFAQGGSFTWRGKTYDAPGVYFDSLKTRLECDSVYRLTLIRKDSIVNISEATVCQRELPYTEWRGRELYASGTYEDRFQTINGADSIYRLKLIVVPTVYSSRQIDLCDGGVYNFHGQSIVRDTVLRDTLSSAAGCDSVCTYVINFNSPYLFESHASLHGQTSYKWRNKTYSTPGTYEEVYTTVKTGCDSIYRLVLHKNPILRVEESDTICQSDAPYVWRGRNIYQSGNYYDSVGTVYGADTVYQLALVVNQTYVNESTTTLCEGETFTFNGQQITTSQVCEAKLLSISGCDSIVRVFVNFIPSYIKETEVSISSRQSYTWRGQTYTTSGIREERVTALSGCDSIFRLNLHVYPVYEYNETVSICQSAAPYMWQNRDLYTSGVYSVAYTTVNGYDSVYNLTLTVNPEKTSTQYLELCDGDTYEFFGQTVATAGVYEETIYSAAGCDSIVRLVVNSAPKYNKREYAEVCAGGTYDWRGMTGLTAPNTYTTTVMSSTGCDSTFTLILNEAPSYSYIKNLYFCDGESVEYNGQVYDAPGEFTTTYVSAVGCDSTVRVIVHAADRYYFRDTLRLTNQQSTTWHGQLVDAAGTYYDYGRTAHGCDSTYELVVIMQNTYHFDDYAVICEGEKYPWHGADYSAGGVYNIMGTTAEGRDSIYTLHLTVNPRYEQVSYVIDICEGESFKLHDTTVTSNAVLNDTLLSVNGCDSIIKYVVRFNPGFFNSSSRTIRSGEEFTWHGQTISAPGRYYDSHENAAHCDSIYELIVDLSHDYKFIENLTLCRNEADTFVWVIDGTHYSETGTYFHNLRTVADDADSIYVLNLTVNETYIVDEHYTPCEGEVLHVHGFTITSDTLCYDTLYTSHGCDSIVRISVSFNPTYRVEQTATFTRGGTYDWVGHSHVVISQAGVYFDSLKSVVTGCDSIYVLKLSYNEPYSFHEDTVLCESNLPLVWHGHEYWESDTYYDSLFTRAGMDSVYSITLTVNPTYANPRIVNLCPGNKYIYKGIECTTDTVLRDTLTSSLGCDSIEITYVNLAQSFHMIEEIVIPEDSVLSWHNGRYGHEGTYFDSHKSLISGCDSIYELHLKISHGFYHQADTVLCESELPLVWHHRNLWQSGIYYDSLTTVAGADSVYRIDLKVNKSYEITEQINICFGDVAQYKDSIITVTSVFSDTLRTVDGCDSIRKIVYNVLPKYLFVEEHVITEDSVLTWHGHQYNIAGTYQAPYTSVVNGCDSIYELHLKVSHGFYHEADTVLCESELPLVWHHRNLWESGTYYDSLKNVAGADSVYRMDLKVNKAYVFTEQINICSGDVAQYKDSVITVTSTFSDTLRTVDGCDSIRVLVYNVLPTFHRVEDHVITADSVLSWHGHEYNIPGTYFDPHTSVLGGCDSIYELHLHVSEGFYHQADTTVCESDLPIQWHNRYIGEAGFYYDSLKNVAGSDSVYRLDVKVKKSYVIVDHIDFCAGDTAFYKGDTIVSTRMFTDSLISVDGCDSLRTVIYNFNPTYYFFEEHTICSDSTFIWHGRQCAVDGVYWDAWTTKTGCDSIYEMRLHVNTATHDGQVVAICRDSLPYTFVYNETDTIILWRDTTILYSFKTECGCDSLFEFTLQFTDKCSEVDSIPLCPGDSVWVFDRWYNQQGLYSLEFNTNFKNNYPDSVYRFYLYPAKTHYFEREYEICSVELPFILNGREYYRDTVFNDTLKTVEGCDSVFHVKLTVHDTPFTKVMAEICEGDVFNYRGKNYTQVGIFYDTLHTIDACDSIFRIVINRAPTYFFDEKVTFVHGQPYTWHGKQITAPGVYYDSLITHGSQCDSIYRLTASMARSFYHFDSVHVCDNHLPYEWQGRLIYTDGLHYDSLKGYMGNDSVYALRLVVDPSYYSTSVIEINDAASYLWRGNYITEQGEYFDTLRTSCNCDSVFHLIVNKQSLSEIPITEEPIAFCEGEVYTFRGFRIMSDTVLYDTLLTAGGRDSIIRYVISQRRTVYRERFATIPDNQTYDFFGTAVNNKGTYFHHEQYAGMSDCDSLVVKLTLTVYPTHYKEQSVSICAENTPYIYNNKEIYRDTTIVDTLRTVDGYDSIIVTRLSVHGSIEPTVVPVTLCEGDVLRLRSGDYYEPGNYYDTLLSVVTGCDSIIHYIVNKGQTYHIYENATFCENRSYTWRGHHNDIVLTRPGLYYDSLTSVVSQCDSIYYLNLEPKGVYRLDTTILVCYDELPYQHAGQFYYDNQEFLDTFTSYSCGCDSIRHIKYVLTNKCSEYQLMHRCTNEVIHIGSYEIRREGTYRFQQWTQEGLDSVARIQVQDEPIFGFHTYDTICQGDSVIFQNTVYKKAGQYSHEYETVWGCDSIYTLHLYVHPAFSKRQDIMLDTIADYELPYNWRGQFLKGGGQYYDTLYTVHGCDSVVSLRLKVYDTDTVIVERTICRGETLIYNDTAYTEPVRKTYLSNYHAVGYSRCVIFSLSVVDTTRLISVTLDEPCADAADLYLTPHYNGATPAFYSVRFLEQKAAREGFVDLIDEPYSGSIVIPVPSKQAGYYVTPGYYKIRLSLSNGYCAFTPLDTTIIIRYPSSVMHQKWNNVVALYKAEKNGNYTFVDYSWEVLDKNITALHAPYLYSDLLEPGDRVVVNLTRQGDSRPVPSCPLTIQPYNPSGAAPVLLAPSRVPHSAPVTQIEAKVDGTYRIFDTTGRLLRHGTFVQGKQEVELPATAGFYLVQLEPDNMSTPDGSYSDAEMVTERVLVY